MKMTDFIKHMSSATPAGELLKLATIIAATILADKVSDIVREALDFDDTNLIDYNKESE